MEERSSGEIREQVKNYYGEKLQSNKDLKTNACCTAEAMPQHVRPIASALHPEILDRFYGCGSPIPEALAECTIVDLGCGTGRDSYIFSKLVGESGSVIGVDMTDEQLAVAEKHLAYQMDAFEHKTPNITFKKGFIEDLASLGIEDDSVDVVTSNCVLNLSPDKGSVFREIFRILRPGGELYFSDIFSDRRVPENLSADPVLRGECLGGALYTEDFRRLLQQLGCPDFRIVKSSPLAVQNAELASKLGNISFFSMTVRAFKISSLEDCCEDYGQVATYLGSIPEAPNGFTLDDHHYFEKGKPMLVCGNTAAMLEETRFKPHFEVRGDRSTHFGLFDCGPTSVAIGEMEGSCC